MKIVSPLFTDLQKHRLKIIGGEKNQDSKFVLKCTEFLYESNREQLTTKVVVRRNGSKGKEPMTPTKVAAIHSAMKYRCDAVNVNAERCSEQYVNRLISRAIGNIRKSVNLKRKRVHSETEQYFDETDEIEVNRENGDVYTETEQNFEVEKDESEYFKMLMEKQIQLSKM